MRLSPRSRPQPTTLGPLGVHIPQVCLHFRWLLVIAERNLCQRRSGQSQCRARAQRAQRNQVKTERRQPASGHGKAFI